MSVCINEGTEKQLVPGSLTPNGANNQNGKPLPFHCPPMASFTLSNIFGMYYRTLDKWV